MTRPRGEMWKATRRADDGDAASRAPEPASPGSDSSSASGRPRGRRGLPGPRIRARVAGPSNEALSALIIFIVSRLSWLAIAGVVVAHALFADEGFPMVVRLLTAVPAVLVILEGRAYLRAPKGELPFVLMALFQYYLAFSLAIFFDLTFYDLGGPVHFSSEAQVAAGVAVAVGALSIWAGGRMGERAGRDVQRSFLRSLPPAEVPERWDEAFYVYSAGAVLLLLVATFAPSVIPSSLIQPIMLTLAFDFAMGLSLARPTRKLGLLAPQGFVALGVIISMFNGMLELTFRVGMEYVAGRWAASKRFSARLIVVVGLIYMVIQPIKGRFRQVVWGQEARGAPVGASGRITAWRDAASYYDEGSSHPSTENNHAAIDRLSELGAVMHAMQVIPNRVDYLNGKGLLPILYSPIPRAIWPDKPTTKETVQMYGVIFGRQTLEGAQTTAFTLPILVEGYWNFGWPGVVALCASLGFWMGLSQRVFAGDHWALRAMGVAQFSSVTAVGSIVFLYGGLFQTYVGRMLACWGVYWLAKALSGRRSAAAGVGMRRAAWSPVSGRARGAAPGALPQGPRIQQPRGTG